MPRCLFLLDPKSKSSGIPALCKRILGKLVSSGADVTVILPKSNPGFPSYQTFEESYPINKGQFDIVWVPFDSYSITKRRELTWEIERQHQKYPLDRIVSFGGLANFSASVAGQLCGVRTSVYLTYADMFSHYFNQPQELDTIAKNADLLLSCNPQVLTHLVSFYDIRHKVGLLDSRPLANELTSNNTREESADESSYFVTTGNISNLVFFDRLMIRILEHFTQGMQKWVHVGNCDINIRLTIDRHLTSLGLQDRYEVTGNVSRTVYEKHLLNAKFHLVPEGELDTIQSVYESLSWNIPLDLPSDFPYPMIQDESSQSNWQHKFFSPQDMFSTITT